MSGWTCAETSPVGRYNFLIEGVSGTGKTSVCHELRRRGLHAINGDTDLAYQGDPSSGEPVTGAPSHDQHIWRIEQVRDLAADGSERFTFFCGGSRNVAQFQEVFDDVFVLEIDTQTLVRRLARRPADEFGGKPAERDVILHLHSTREGIPKVATGIDARAPLSEVVDAILEHAALIATSKGALATGDLASGGSTGAGYGRA